EFAHPIIRQGGNDHDRPAYERPALVDKFLLHVPKRVNLERVVPLKVFGGVTFLSQEDDHLRCRKGWVDGTVVRIGEIEGSNDAHLGLRVRLGMLQMASGRRPEAISLAATLGSFEDHV